MQSLPSPYLEFGVPVYGGRVVLYRHYPDFAQAMRSLDPAQEPDASVNGTVFVCQDPRNNRSWLYVLGIFYAYPSLRIHELTHLSLSVFKNVDIDPVCGNGEPFAYLMEALYLELTRSWNKVRYRKKEPYK